MLTQTKPWYKSYTIWSVVISAASFIVDKYAIKDSSSGDILATILGSGGAISAIYNRVAASSKITPDPKPMAPVE